MHRKEVLSGILALLLCLGLSGTALAQEEETLTQHNSQMQTEADHGMMTGMEEKMSPESNDRSEMQKTLRLRCITWVNHGEAYLAEPCPGTS